MLTQIMEYTDLSQPDHAAMTVALKKAETLCEHINAAVHQKENTEQLEWLQAHVQFVNLDEELVFNSQTNFLGPRKLLHWGKFFKVESNNVIGWCSSGHNVSVESIYYHRLQLNIHWQLIYLALPWTMGFYRKIFL